MRFKDKRQHKKKPNPEFTESRDRFGNLTITALLGTKTVSKSHVADFRIPQVKKELIKQLGV